MTGEGPSHDGKRHYEDMVTHFPFEEVIRRLDGEQDEPRDHKAMADGLRRLFAWFVQYNPALRYDDRFMRAVGRRVVAFVWALDPSLLRGHALADIARTAGIERAALSKYAAAAAKAFGLANRPSVLARRRAGVRYRRRTMKRGG